MLPKIHRAAVVSITEANAQALGHWQTDESELEALMRFAVLAANTPNERLVNRGEQDLFALPLDHNHSNDGSAGQWLVVATGRLTDGKARDSLTRFLKAGIVWYQLLQQTAQPKPIASDESLHRYVDLSAEFSATEPFATACSLLVSRLAKRWQQAQLALVYQATDDAQPTLLALSDTAKVLTRTEAAQALLQRAKYPQSETTDGTAIKPDQGDRLTALDHWGGRWTVLSDATMSEAQRATFAPLWHALVPLLAQRHRQHLRPWQKWRLWCQGQPSYRWLAAATFLGLLWLPMDYRVGAAAELEGLTQRAVVAPEDGFIRSSYFRAGDIVQPGDLIAQLDDDELKLEHKKRTNELAELDRQYRQALVEGELSQSRVVKNQIAQSQAELDLIQHQLSRTQLVAPFAGVIIEGDLTRSEGAPVEKGQILYEIAPAGEFRLVLQVDERNMAALSQGRRGTLYLNARPSQGIEFTITRIGNLAQSDGPGPQRYRVEALMSETPASLNLQPGMQGVAKVAAGRRALGWIVLHRPWHWLVLKWWSWAP